MALKSIDWSTRQQLRVDSRPKTPQITFLSDSRVDPRLKIGFSNEEYIIILSGETDEI